MTRSFDMTLAQIKRNLETFGDLDLSAIDANLLNAFCIWVKDCDYGGPETMDAFLHYRSGWAARGDARRVCKECSTITECIATGVCIGSAI